jgi:hypothetical protein
VKQLDRIEQKRRDLLAVVTALDPRVATTRPLSDAWSVAEIIEHLVLVENTVIGDFSALDALVERPRRLKDRILYRVVMFVLRFRIRVKAPSRAMVPTGRWSLTEAISIWEENHRRLRRYVESLDRTGLRRQVFRHPITGPVDVAQGIAMMEAHLDTHIRQVRDRIRSLTPAAAASDTVFPER